MKKNYFLTLLSLLFCFAIQAQVSYSGNGNTGFGGTVGGSSVSINDNGTTVSFTFSRGGDLLTNAVVIYIDSKSGGFSDTSGFTDSSDGLRRAISSYTGGVDRATITFPAGFTADYAIAFNNGFAGIWELQNGIAHTFISSANLSPTSNSSAASHTFDADFSEIGTNSLNNFKFVTTYTSETAFLSNEAIGDATIGGNPGFTGTITFTGDRSYPNTWTGTTDSDWATATNWTEGTPTSTHNVYIPAVTNDPIAATAVTINKGIIKSGASFIAQDAFTGTITYERNLPSSNWHLVSSPVSGQMYNDAYVTANGIDTSIPNPTNRGIATYTTAANTWSYVQVGGSGTFANGTGYSFKRATAGNISFTGTINTSDVSVAVSSASNGFNLIGNPFTSHVDSGTFLENNTSNLISETMWVWNQANDNYETYISGVGAFILQPTQGFFVRSSTGTSLNFLEINQTTNGDAFQKSANTEVKLMMNDGTADRFAKMYYLENVTKGFDNGFDGETFGGIENSVDVFTNLLENNEGKKFQVQSLPNTDMETMIVPVGVKADAGKEITFTAEALNLPGELKVFLEDRLTNTVTRLDEANSSYKVTLNDALNGTGRFFLHTKASGVLSTDDVVLQNTNIYAINNNTLRVVGLPSGNANVKMYSILGKQVMQTSFSSTGVKEISIPKLSSGMYIIQVETAAGKLNKKIVLE